MAPRREEPSARASSASGSPLALCASAGGVLVASALWFSGLSFDPVALALITVAAGLAVASVALADRGDLSPGRAWGNPILRRGPAALLGAGIAIGIACQLAYPPGGEARPAHASLFRLGAIAASIVAGSYLWTGAPANVRRWRFAVLLAVFAGMGSDALLATPDPGIDVWTLQQGGAEALASGVNPYEAEYPNPYPNEEAFGPGFVRGGRIVAYPYPPLVALLGVPPFLLLGDVRWMYLVALVVAAAAIRRLGHGLLAELAAVLMLFQPGTFIVLELAWTEPVVLAAWSLSALAVASWLRDRPGGWATAGIAAGVLLSVKQYAPLLALPLAVAAPRGGRARAAALALAGAAIVAAPFVVWNPGELYRDVVRAQLLQPFRMDSISWLAAWARVFGTRPTPAIGFALAALALAIGLRGAVSLGRAVAVATLAFLVLVLFNKQAFFNYYWLVAGLFCSAVAWSSSEDACRPASLPGPA